MTSEKKYNDGDIAGGCYRVIRFLGCHWPGSSKYEVECIHCGRRYEKWTSTLIQRNNERCRYCPERRGMDPMMFRTLYPVLRRTGGWGSVREMYDEVGDRPAPGYVLRSKTYDDPKPGDWQWVEYKPGIESRAERVEVLGVRLTQAEWGRVCGVSRERIRVRLSKMSPMAAILRYRSACQYIAENTGASLDSVLAAAQESLDRHAEICPHARRDAVVV